VSWLLDFVSEQNQTKKRRHPFETHALVSSDWANFFSKQQAVMPTFAIVVLKND